MNKFLINFFIILFVIGIGMVVLDCYSSFNKLVNLKNEIERYKTKYHNQYYNSKKFMLDLKNEYSEMHLTVNNRIGDYFDTLRKCIEVLDEEK